MLSAEQIVQVLLERIGYIYAEPQMVVQDVCELNGLLHELHWLYAIATESLDSFVEVVAHESPAEFCARIKLRDSQRIVELPEHATEIIDRWRRIDERLGLIIPPIIPSWS